MGDLPKSAGGELYSVGFSVAPVMPDLLDAWLRMLRLMERRNEIAALAPAYEREILFRVLQGPLGWMLRDIATPDSALSRIGIAIQWIRENFTGHFASRLWQKWWLLVFPPSIVISRR